MPLKESPHSTRRVRAAVREKMAVELRIGGHTYAQIALKIAESEGAEKPVSTVSIHKMIKRSFTRLREHTDIVTADLRQMELERLDVLLQGLWADAKDGDKAAVHQTLAVLDRRYRLLGIEAPTEVDRAAMTWVQLMTQVQSRIGDGNVVDVEVTETKLLGNGDNDD